MAGRSFVPIFQGWRSLRAFHRTSRHAARKRLLSNGTIPPLNEPLPNMPSSPPHMISGTEAWQNRHDHVTHVTTLENGIKVASEDSFGQFSTVGGKFQTSQSRIIEITSGSGNLEVPYVCFSGTSYTCWYRKTDSTCATNGLSCISSWTERFHPEKAQEEAVPSWVFVFIKKNWLCYRNKQ